MTALSFEVAFCSSTAPLRCRCHRYLHRGSHRGRRPNRCLPSSVDFRGFEIAARSKLQSTLELFASFHFLAAYPSQRGLQPNVSLYRACISAQTPKDKLPTFLIVLTPRVPIALFSYSAEFLFNCLGRKEQVLDSICVFVHNVHFFNVFT